MITDLVEIRRLAGTKEAENLQFRRYLKAHHLDDGPLHQIAKEVGKQIDCTKCANCCRSTLVNVSGREIEVIARHLELPADEVARQCTVPDPEGGGGSVLRHTGNGCIFLEGNLCMVYDSRPRDCHDFPYLASDERSTGNRMSSACRRASFCPIVYNSIEEYKKVVGFHASPHAA